MKLSACCAVAVLFVHSVDLPAWSQDQPASPSNAIENFNLSTGGTGLYRPDKWGVVKVSLRNPQQHEVHLLATTHALNEPTLQYGRRLWMPARSQLTSWNPMRMPPLDHPQQTQFDLRSMVINRSSGVEAMSANEFGAMQFDQSFRVAADEQVTALIVDRSNDQTPGLLSTDPQEFVLTARLDRGLKYNLTILGDPLLPASEELLDALDHLVIASNRIVTDAAGISAIRRWVASGGRLWIMADMVSPTLLAALLGDDDNITEVNRVDLTSTHLDAGAWSLSELRFTRELERPVRFVRLVAEDHQTDFTSDGWPAAFWKNHGEGRILVTTIGGDAWVRPRTPSDPPAPGGVSMQTQFFPSESLSYLALQFFTPRAAPLIPRVQAEEQIRQLIGYAIPDRTLTVGILAGFTSLIPLLAIWLARRGRLEWLGLVIPVLSLGAAGMLMALGWNSRTTIPATTAIIQHVQPVPGTEEIRTSGLAGIFTNESQVAPLSGNQGGWMSPSMSGFESTTRRMAWSDIDTWSWELLPFTPGLRMVSFQTGGRVDEPVEAVAEFDARGVSGKLTLPAGLAPGDAVIIAPRGRIGVQLHPDGRFTAAASAVLGPDQYLSANVLSDEQQRRSQLMSQLPAPPLENLFSPVLMVWTRYWDVGTSLGRDGQTVGSALVSVPIRWQRPAAGTPLVITGPFLPFREVEGPDGLPPKGLYDRRSARWTEKTGTAEGWVAFSVPADLLPVELTSATITFKVLGPMRRLELSGANGSTRQSLKTWDSPVGTLRAEITDPTVLKLDSRGRFLIRIDVGIPDEPDPATTQLTTGKMDPQSYWQFEDVSAQVTGQIQKRQ
ncbi:MAG: hypothetical protein JSS49_08585 [Planctomycetes bacterium]|nr:hypothetical protein [Planctomycetota bacterium]